MLLRPKSMTNLSVCILPLVALLTNASLVSQDGKRLDQENKETRVNSTAKGMFEVEMQPRSQDEKTGVNVMSLTKTLSGDFEGTSSGSMLTRFGDPRSSAVYVAIERLQGTLDDREGSFALVHRGVMTADSQELQVTIAPDSGTDELEGIEGIFHIESKDGQHFYVLEYTLPE